MKRVCAICRHAERPTIEAKVLDGGSLESAAREYGLHKTQLWRHMHKHLPRAIEKAQAAIEAAEQADLLSGARAVDQVRDLQRRALVILSEAEADGDNTIALRAIRELRGLTELVGRFTGEDRIANQPTTLVIQTDFGDNRTVDHRRESDQESDQESNRSHDVLRLPTGRASVGDGPGF